MRLSQTSICATVRSFLGPGSHMSDERPPWHTFPVSGYLLTQQPGQALYSQRCAAVQLHPRPTRSFRFRPLFMQPCAVLSDSETLNKLDTKDLAACACLIRNVLDGVCRPREARRFTCEEQEQDLGRYTCVNRTRGHPPSPLPYSVPHFQLPTSLH